MTERNRTGSADLPPMYDNDPLIVAERADRQRGMAAALSAFVADAGRVRAKRDRAVELLRAGLATHNEPCSGECSFVNDAHDFLTENDR